MPETRSMKKIIKDKILEQDKNNKKQYSLNKWRSQLNNNYDEWVDDFGMHQPVVYPITKYCDPLENLQNTDVEKEESQQNTSLSDRFSNYETPLPDKEILVRDDIVSDVVKSNDSNTAEESDEEYELEENDSQESESNESEESFTNEDIVNNKNEWKYRKLYNEDEDEYEYFRNMPVTDYLIPIGIGLFSLVVTYLNYKSSKYKYEDDY